jgi:hypothetical protein
MRFARSIALLSCLLVCCSCGAASPQEAAEESSAVPGPPIEAIDEPSTEDFWWSPRDDANSSTGHVYLCVDGDPGNNDEPCEPSPADIEELRRVHEALKEATKPAKGAEPRAIARLRLTGRRPESEALVVAWRNRAGKLCLGTSEKEEDSVGSGGPFGPCVPENSCREICLSGSGEGSGAETRYLLSGVLFSEGDRLRMTLADGRVITYELTGPLVPGFPKYRVFILDLGRDIDERLELLRKGEVIAQEKRPRREIRWMRCYEDFPPVLPSSDARARKSPLDECLKKAGSD